jgi:hypothetical protein
LALEIADIIEGTGDDPEAELIWTNCSRELTGE